MKCFGLIALLAASWINKVVGKSNLYTGWTQKFNNEPYESLTAQVGDTITFIWTIDEIQNVFIHPTNDCTQTGRIAVGNKSPTEYTFKPEDGAPGGKTIFFANDIGDRCESFGMSLIVTVFPEGDSAPIPTTLTPEPVPTNPPFPPTRAPVFPTDPPVAPTLPPVAPVAPAPTSSGDSLIPNLPPVFAPMFPEVIPTDPPTAQPTSLPTSRPTLRPTNNPTKSPTILVTTYSPTIVTTENENDKKIMKDLQMTLSGIDSFSDITMFNWAKDTAAYATSFYENDYEGSTFQTTIIVTNSLASSNSKRSLRDSGRRTLQTAEVVITYNQVVEYANTGDAIIIEDYLAKAPFETQDLRDNYVGTLQNSNDIVLEAVTDASPVTFADERAPTSAPVSTPVEPQPLEPKEGSGLSKAAIIGIACGAGALLIIAILFYIYTRSKKAKIESQMESIPPPASSVAIKPDEVSTLAGPSVTVGSPLHGDRSIGTVDYDYTKAYEDKDHSISYTGGTMGSGTQDFSFPANAGATGAALGPDDGYPRGKFKDEILHIYAPAGKLGVVIDTPDDGAPVVHAVKETSVVVDKVQVGDKLMSVDDEDVRTLTAIKVSKLISRKSAQPSRKLTILRRTIIEEDL